jgi:hypothetical protein
MEKLNNKYAVDGRDPNSYNGIFWCLGRYDRHCGPERLILGTVRYMSSESTAPSSMCVTTSGNTTVFPSSGRRYSPWEMILH